MKKNKINKISSLIALILSVIFLILLTILNVIPLKYFSIILIVFLGLNLVNLFFSFCKKLKNKGKIGFMVLSVVVSLISIIGSFYLLRTIMFMGGNFKFKGYTTENYSVIVLKDSQYQELDDIEDKEIGVLKIDQNESKMIERLREDVDFTEKEYQSLLELKNALYINEVEVIVIEDSYKSILEEEDEEFKDKINVIYTFSLKYKVENIVKNVNVTKDTFTIYVAGIDTYGAVSSVSRSDVNMLLTINPKTNQVLLTSIPRDYYVQLHGTTGYKDKLTHAGIYGVDMSVQTIEDLLEVDINYYVRVNFTSLIKLVDALGGIDVYSEYTFNSNAGYESEEGYSFLKGYNHVNGVQALAFARTRHAFISGDRVRGQNQQAVIEAIIRKAASPAIITKYTSILDSLEGSFETNFSMDDITKLAKYQIDKMPSWNISSISLDGSDSYQYTYSFSGQPLYVMLPNEDSVKNAKEKLDMVYKGEKLESSYGEVGDIQNPGTVNPIVPQQPVVPENNVTEEDDNEDVELPDEDSDNNDDNSNTNESDSSISNQDEVLSDHIEDILNDNNAEDLEE